MRRYRLGSPSSREGRLRALNKTAARRVGWPRLGLEPRDVALQCLDVASKDRKHRAACDNALFVTELGAVQHQLGSFFHHHMMPPKRPDMPR